MNSVSFFLLQMEQRAKNKNCSHDHVPSRPSEQTIRGTVSKSCRSRASSKAPSSSSWATTTCPCPRLGSLKNRLRWEFWHNAFGGMLLTRIPVSRKGSRTGQCEKLNYNTIAAQVSAILTGSSGAEIVLHSFFCLKARLNMGCPHEAVIWR